jgi:hypothetical protein
MFVVCTILREPSCCGRSDLFTMLQLVHFHLGPSSMLLHPPPSSIHTSTILLHVLFVSSILLALGANRDCNLIRQQGVSMATFWRPCTGTRLRDNQGLSGGRPCCKSKVSRLLLDMQSHSLSDSSLLRVYLMLLLSMDGA